MKDILSLLADLRRPRLLICAAQHGAAQYRSERDLHRVLKSSPPPWRGAAMMRLMEMEAELNEARHNHEAGYRAARHVEVLAALLGEATALRAS